MAQQSDRLALAADVVATDRTPDVAIFSAPGVGVVMQWWAESNRRWAEQNRLKPMFANSDPNLIK